VAGDGSLGKTNSGLDRRLFALQDANWNVVALANSAGAIVERDTYTSYGQRELRNADFTTKANVGQYGWTVLYTGQDLDLETGLMFYNARYYSVYVGTFISRDPIGYSGGDNLYEYVNDSPLMHIDSAGTAIAVPSMHTVCNFVTGKPDIVKDLGYFFEGPCGHAISYIHESVHIAEISTCCAAASKALTDTIVDMTLKGSSTVDIRKFVAGFKKEWKDWQDANNDIEECAAYVTSSLAAEAAARIACNLPSACGGNSSAVKQCCSELQSASTNDWTLARQHCAAASGKKYQPCPWPKNK
jgi:RHS repeat-associated protein